MKKRIQKEREKNKQTIQEILEKNGEELQPLLQIVNAGRIVVNELIYSAGQALVESLLQISAEELAGKKQRRVPRAVQFLPLIQSPILCESPIKP